MIWAILLWVVIVSLLIVCVLRLAHGESQREAFTDAVAGRSRGEREREKKGRTPRIAGIAPAFRPASDVKPGSSRPPRSSAGDPNSTEDNQVYVNAPSVVEVKGLFAADPDDTIHTRIPKAPR